MSNDPQVPQSGEKLTEEELEKMEGGITGPNNGLYFKGKKRPAAGVNPQTDNIAGSTSNDTLTGDAGAN